MPILRRPLLGTVADLDGRTGGRVADRAVVRESGSGKPEGLEYGSLGRSPGGGGRWIAGSPEGAE